ncbi:MAG: hypothetical protein KJ718_04220 [Nanoarchaeota archaeon]|nr:hypothetical protein [Nanoarchaeota archaeon]MBU1051734.1 hypothetical protein [Nanoarchaeota archaeon]MBU1988370.1 hypothetical protein [Nanoarchaeota archaeon]
MERGRVIIEGLVGISPVFFAPSNSLYNQSTLEAASELGYRYFGDRAFIPFPPYGLGSLIVVPESSLEKGRIVSAASHYVHYDKIDSYVMGFKSRLAEATSLSDVKPSSEIPTKLIRQNHRRKIMWKLGRDVFNLPGRILRRKI